jgi:hypothetical protein
VLFYIGPEFIEVLQSFVGNRPAEDTPLTVSEGPQACNSKDRLARLQRVAFRIRSVVKAVTTGGFILLLICAFMLLY